MNYSSEFVDIDVDLNKEHVEWLDQEALRLGCSRNDLICQAVDHYLDRVGELFRERDKKRKENEEASRTGHTADQPPTTD